MSKKALVSASVFLQAVAGEVVDHDVPGVGMVRIRSLGASEGKALFEKFAGNESELFVQVIRLGLVEPALDDDALDALRTAKAGPVMKLATAIMQLSGMSDDEALSGEAGGGSSTVPAEVPPK